MLGLLFLEAKGHWVVVFSSRQKILTRSATKTKSPGLRLRNSNPKNGKQRALVVPLLRPSLGIPKKFQTHGELDQVGQHRHSSAEPSGSQMNPRSMASNATTAVQKEDCVRGKTVG